jgi:UDP-2,4-diacetamido-2,4,6-trideoxy-beta-L-altropyranose hydrolase
MSRSSAKRRVVIFASANSQIGGGHLARQMVLARDLVSTGFSVSFIGELKESHQAKIRGMGIDVHPIKNPNSVEEHGCVLLKVDSNSSVHCVVIDNYSLLEQLSSGVRLNPNFPQVHFQDGQATAPGGSILVNSGVSYGEPYDCGNYERVFLGLEAALISEEIRELKKRRSAAKGLSEERQLGFITLGYGNQEDLIKRVTAALIEIDSKLAKNFFVARKEPLKLDSGQRQGVGSRDARTVGYAEALLSFGICIGAAGLSAYERAFLGIPSINIPLAKNQIGIARILAESGAALELPNSDADSFVATLGIQLTDLRQPENWEAMVSASEKLVDSENSRKISYAISEI